MISACRSARNFLLALNLSKGDTNEPKLLHEETKQILSDGVSKIGFIPNGNHIIFYVAFCIDQRLDPDLFLTSSITRPRRRSSKKFRRSPFEKIEKGFCIHSQRCLLRVKKTSFSR